METFYNLTDTNMAGEEVSMSSFRGQVLLFVNVASKWGLTHQNYTELSTLADEYTDRGLTIMAFPCNQFAREEPVRVKKLDINIMAIPKYHVCVVVHPQRVVSIHWLTHLCFLFFSKWFSTWLCPPPKKGTHEEILSFVDQFGVRDKLTWFEKANVNGTNTREVYSYLKQELPNQSGALEIEWNFEKFLVTHDGKPYKRYSPQCSPFAMREDIEQLLKEVKK